jgi:hypothetical protein
MSFKEEINDAISHVVGIRVLIQSSRRPRPGEKSDEEKKQKRVERIADSKKKLQDFSPERIDSLVSLAQEGMPMDLDEIVHKLERAEFLLEDVAKGKDRKSNLLTLVESFKTTPVLQNALLAIPSLKKLLSETQ